MTKQDVSDFFLPFHQLGTKDITGLPAHLHEGARMRNRWRLPMLRPFIQRWAILTSLLGLLLLFVSSAPSTFVTLLLGLLLWTAWAASLGMTCFLVYLYSMRPR